MVRQLWALIFTLLWLTHVSAAERVISLAPSLTEILYDLEVQERLVGVLATDGPSVPASAVRVGSLGQLNVEQVLQLQPDLVLNWPGSVSARQLQQVEGLGISVYTAQAKSMQELAQQFADLGAVLGVAERGEQLKQRALQRLTALERRYQRDTPVRVFYQLWDKPMYTLGGGQIITDALQYCGAQNIFAQVPVLAPQVNLEAVLAEQPDLIVHTSDSLRHSWPAAVAIRMLTVPDDGLERPSWQMFSALEKLCQAIDDAMKDDV